MLTKQEWEVKQVYDEKLRSLYLMEQEPKETNMKSEIWIYFIDHIINGLLLFPTL